MLISCCMLTLNEIDHVALSVPAVLEHVDELVVIDGGSTDGTVEMLQSFGSRVRVEVILQSGSPYTADWEQEERRQRLQDLCNGDWILQLDADEVTGNRFDVIRSIVKEADSETQCFGIWRLDYAPDLYHGYLPYTAHPSIPRIWRKGSVDWLTGRAIHMTPYLSGTKEPVTKFKAPTYVVLDQVIHHIHRAYWVGKSKHKVRYDEAGRQPLARSAKIGEYAFRNDRVPDAVVPECLKFLRRQQKDELLRQLDLSDDFATINPEARPCDAQGFFLPSNEAKLAEIIGTLANPLLFVEIGSWLGASTRFLASKVGGCVIAIDHWQGSQEHHGSVEYANVLPSLYQQFLTNCYAYRDRIVPVRLSSKSALELDIQGVNLLYVDGAHDYASVLFDLENWSLRISPHGVICGDDWLWGDDKPIQKAVREFAESRQYEVHSAGNFWWLS